MEKLSYFAFIILGISGTVNGMALPFFIERFELSLSLAGLLLFASSLGYLTASTAFPYFTKQYSSKSIIAVALFTAGLGYGLLPLMPVWWLSVLVGFAANLGCGTLDVGFNTLIAGLEPHRAKPAMSWLHFSYGIGALIGPAFLSRLVSAGFSWFSFYFSTSILFALFLGLWHYRAQDWTCSDAEEERTGGNSSVFQEPFFWLLFVSIFIYVSAETALVGWIPTYLTNMNVYAADATVGISIIWLGITIGRGLCTKLSLRFTPKRILLLLTSGAALTMTVLIFIPLVWLVFAVLFLVGLFLSAIFPMIMLQGAILFPNATAQAASGLVIAGSLGALVGPSLLGIVGESYSLQAGIGITAAMMALSTFLISRCPATPQSTPSRNKASWNHFSQN